MAVKKLFDEAYNQVRIIKRTLYTDSLNYKDTKKIFKFLENN